MMSSSTHQTNSQSRKEMLKEKERMEAPKIIKMQTRMKSLNLVMMGLNKVSLLLSKIQIIINNSQLKVYNFVLPIVNTVTDG